MDRPSRFLGRGTSRYLHGRLRCIRNGEEGQGMTEYAVILVFVSIVGVALLTEIGLKVVDLLALARDSFP
jgi:Flp pilus assembly pilin Flp